MKRAIERLRGHEGTVWAVIAATVAAVAYTVMWMVFRPQVMSDSPNPLALAVKGFADGLFLLLPFWWIGRRWRWTATLMPWVMGGWMWANLLYYRQFKLLLPFASLRFTQNADSVLFNSIAGLWRGADILLLIMPLAFTLAWALWLGPRLRPYKLSLRFKLLASGLSLLLFGLLQLWSTMSLAGELRRNGDPASISTVYRIKYVDYIGENMALFHRGFPLYCLTEGVKELATRRGVTDLSPEEQRSVDEYIDEQKMLWGADSTFAEGRGRNLIVIVVESLNSWAVTPEVMPVLDSLTHTHGAIAALNVQSQVSHGGSSDGQLLIDTGLLPLRGGATAMLYYDNRFPSIVSELKPAQSFEVNDVEAPFWHHDDISRALAYDTLYARPCIDAWLGTEARPAGVDASVFAYGLHALKQSRQPFVARLLTLSMHAPFNDKTIPADSLAHVAKRPEEGPVMNRYLAMTGYFDRQLGNFIRGLQAAGLYDNTTIVIVSDHSAPVKEVDGSGRDDEDVVFVAINTGLDTPARRIDRRTGQVDIYPTILHLMGVAEPQWPGLGRSMLSLAAPELNSAVDIADNVIGSPATPAEAARQRRAWDISRLIISSNALAR